MKARGCGVVSRYCGEEGSTFFLALQLFDAFPRCASFFRLRVSDLVLRPFTALIIAAVAPRVSGSRSSSQVLPAPTPLHAKPEVLETDSRGDGGIRVLVPQHAAVDGQRLFIELPAPIKSPCAFIVCARLFIEPSVSGCQAPESIPELH